MRPQHITAENRGLVFTVSRTRKGFNEAAAYHCGKPFASLARSLSRHCFNEAAAYHCGKPAPRGAAVARRGRQASMRPQHITAENRHRG